jgi:Ca-activated chloride channel family protein
MRFLEPLWLVLLLVPLVTGWLERRWPAAAIVRSLLFVSVIAALAHPTAPMALETPTVVFVVDRSCSMDDVQIATQRARLDALATTVPEGTRRALIAFDGRPEILIGPDEPWVLTDWARGPTAEQTDVRAAVYAAAGLISPAGGGRIVVFSDGGDTVGGAAERLANAVPVDGVMIRPELEPPMLVAVELARDVVRPGEVVAGWVDLRLEGAFTLDLEVDGEPIETRRVERGDREVVRERFELSAPEAFGRREVRVTASTQGKTEARTLGFTVAEPPEVLVIADRDAEVGAIISALEQQQFRVRRRRAVEATAADLGHVDLVVLGDVPAVPSPHDPDALNAAFIGALRRWVSAGGGLITLGGDRTYEIGGWPSTDLGRIVPLELHATAEEAEPAATVVHVIDNSCSMGDWSGHHRKMSLANEATVASMRLMRLKDSIEVMAVNTEVHRVLPLQPVVEPDAIAARIRSIKPGGGGIYVYTSLMAAERAIDQATTPVRHVMLYSDAQDAEEKVEGVLIGWGTGRTSFSVAKRLRDKGVTLSVIALGDPRDQDVPFLRQLAEIGGGRFHITREASELRALYVQETRQVLRSVIEETPFRVRAGADHAAFRGVDVSRAPAFLGQVRVRERSIATVVLRGAGDVPTLCVWQYGLGHVASWSTDLGGRWGVGWTSWDAFPKVIAQLSRWALRPPVARGARLEVFPAPEGFEVRVQRLDRDGLALTEGGVVAEVVGDGGALGAVDLRPVEPGRWAGRVHAPAGSVQEIVLRSEGQEVGRQTVVTPDPVERSTRSGDSLERWVSATGGALDPQRVGDLSAPTPRHRSLRIGFMLLAVMLLPADAWVRRRLRGVVGSG